MNYSTFIVKIIEKPVQSFFKNNISLTELVVQFPQVRNKNYLDIFHLNVWGNLSHDVMKYYQVNDYIVVEGYISFRKANHNQKIKQIEMSAFKIYPLLKKNEIESTL
jgi:hypothetical protein